MFKISTLIFIKFQLYPINARKNVITPFVTTELSPVSVTAAPIIGSSVKMSQIKVIAKNVSNFQPEYFGIRSSFILLTSSSNLCCVRKSFDFLKKTLALFINTQNFAARHHANRSSSCIGIMRNHIDILTSPWIFVIVIVIFSA